MTINLLLASSKYMPEYSGSGFRAHNLYKRLCSGETDINLKIICGSETENDCAEYEYDGFRINRLAAKPIPPQSGIFSRVSNISNFCSEFRKTLRFLRAADNKPDLIHIFGQNYVTAATLHFACTEEIPLIIELCNEMNTPHHYVPRPFRSMVRINPKHKHIFVCISERLKKMCLSNDVPEENIWCRPNPVNEDLFNPEEKKQRNTYREKLTKFSEKQILLLYIAKYIARKNHIFLLDVLNELPENYVLFLGGPMVERGPNRRKDEGLFKDIQKEIRVKNLQRRVQLECGFVKNIEEYYKAADVYLFPTREEGLGTPLIESIACGIPVVANMIPGITDNWVKDGANGFISNLNAPEFALKVKNAAAIPAELLLKESERILEAAGNRSIDRQYLEILTEMGKRGTE